VLSGEVDPILWDHRLEEILNVPSVLLGERDRPTCPQSE